MKSICIVILLFLLPEICFPQSSTYYFKNYQVVNGLSSNTITTVIQDKKGFMWFGSRNGLNRFDGNTFKVFQHKLTDSNSIGSNSIFSLFEDREEQLWVGTYKGIYLYNPLKETFRAFAGIRPGEVRFIKGDKDQHIWIISDLTLFKYEPRSRKVIEYPFKNDQAIALHIAFDGSVWAATSGGIIKKYDAKNDRFSDYAVPPFNGVKLSTIKDLCLIDRGTLMIGTMNQVLLFDLQTSKATPLPARPGGGRLDDVHVHTIFRQSPAEFWFGTETGLYVYNMQTQKTDLVRKEISNPYSITDNTVSAIYKDTEGGTWIGTYFGGVNYYSKPFNNFHKYFPEPGKNSLSGNIVHEICKDKYGSLWIGTEDAGLNQLDLQSGQFKSFMPDKTKGSIAYQNIHGLIAVGDELWIGTYEHGLDVMDLKTGKVIRHYDAALDSVSFHSNFIITLYQTKNSDILVGTWNGLFRYNRKTDDFSALPFFNSHIQSIHEDNNGTLWVGTYGSGLYYQNPLSGKKGHIYYQQGNKKGILNNYINSVYEDSRKNLWLCTEGGLSRLELSSGKITNFSVENGLPDNQIFRIAEDNQGMLWVSTSKGLSRFHPEKLLFKTYHTAHGLPTEQFNYNSSFKDQDGTLYFGTVKGLTSFNPADFIKNNYVPPVYITGLQINNREATIAGKHSPLQQAIGYTQHITLPYDQSNITLDVAALSYIIPEMNTYQYKMEGLDENWIELKNNRKIYYTKLAPGKYTFRLKGANSDNVWNNRETILNINITPPVWATAWAYLLYAGIVLLIAFTIFRYYHLAITEKNKRKIDILEINKEREIYNAKIEFFTNVAHEIRTPLTLIKMPLDKLMQQAADKPETNENLEMIKKNTGRLIDLTNQLLDFRKAEAANFSLNFTKTDINELLSALYLQFKPAAEQKNFTYKLDLPRITLHAYVDREALRKIISNLLNNAIKYSEQLIQVRLLPFSSDDTQFHIEIRNDGYIIPDHYKEKIFEPFYRIKETAEETGTGIGLSLARSLTELHEGTLELKTSPGALNIFLLSLPIHQDNEIHFEEENEVPEEEHNLPEEQYKDRKAVLIVEDNKEILGYLRKELRGEYQILQAYNGQEALELLQNNQVQLVVSDIMMPVMDGIELCKKIKHDIQFSHIPIILLTAKNSLNSKIEGLEAGADAYIEKPFSLEHLSAQISNLLNNRNIIKEYFARSPLTHIHGIANTTADKEFLDQLNRIIYDNITDDELNVDKLSSLMNMSRPTLYRKIKGLSDLTPNELINLSRLKKGAELLAEGSYKINEVANLIGYSLPTNFSRDFQKQFGMSPSAYLNDLKKEQSDVS